MDGLLHHNPHPHSDPATLTKLACAVVRDYSPLKTDIEDTEEFADVMLALWQAGCSYDPAKGSVSTFVYTVGRRAMYRGWSRRKGKSVSAVNEFDGYDETATEDPFLATDVQDEYDFAVRKAGLSDTEHESYHNQKTDPVSMAGRCRAGAKVKESLERRQLFYA